MTDFEKALAQAKKFAEKNENQITETEFEAITDSYKIEPDEMITILLLNDRNSSPSASRQWRYEHILMDI